MSSNDQPPMKPDYQPPQAMHTGMPCRINSKELLGDRVELIIEHEGREYRLRITQNGKLILTA